MARAISLTRVWLWAHGGTLVSIAGNSTYAGGAVGVGPVSTYWQWHVHMQGAVSHGLIQHGAIGGGAATAAAAVHRGGIAAAMHAGALVHAVALGASAYLGLEAAKWLTEKNRENVELLERLADDPTLVQRDPYLETQLRLWRQGFGGFRRI